MFMTQHLVVVIQLEQSRFIYIFYLIVDNIKIPPPPPRINYELTAIPLSLKTISFFLLL